MSTRATYQFLGDYGLNVTFYIHHDGYPEGAVEYLIHAIRHGQISPDNFFRQNDRAELTGGHDAHGDTEYQYTVKKDGTLTVKHVKYGENYDDRTFVTIFTGQLAEFINQKKGKKVFALVKTHKYAGKPRWATLTELNSRLRSAKKQLKEYKTAHPTMIGNISSLEGDVEGLQDAIKQFKAVAKEVA